MVSMGVTVIEIKNLAKRKDLVKQIATWLWDEWGSMHNYNFFEALVKNCLREDDLPQLFGAFTDGELIGTVALIRNDLMSRQDLTPWLSGLYIAPAFRGRGVGALLLDYVVKKAEELGYPAVYLGSLHIGYYENKGWSFLENGILPSGDLIRIYYKTSTTN